MGICLLFGKIGVIQMRKVVDKIISKRMASKLIKTVSHRTLK